MLKNQKVPAFFRWFGYILRLLMKKIRQIFLKLLSDDLLRHTSILFSGMMVVHVCNMVFQMVVGRVLVAEEFTLLATFLAVLAIIQRPLSTLRNGVNHYCSLLQNDGRIGDVKRLLGKWLLLTGIPAFLLGAVTVWFRGPLAGFLHLNRTDPVVIAGAVLPALFWFPILIGATQGLQLFGRSSVATVFGALIRLFLGAGFVWFLYPACGWAMLGHGLSIYVSVVILFCGLLLVLWSHACSSEALPSLRMYLLQSFFILAAYGILFTSDVIFIKHYLPEDTDFAFAATISRMVALLPGPIVMAMFPKVVSRGTGTAVQHQVFVKSLSLTAVATAVGVIGCCLFPGLLAHIVFGKSEASFALQQLVRMMSLVMGVSVLLNVTAQFLMAQRRFRQASCIVVSAVLYVLSACLFHSSTMQIVLAALICNVMAFVVSLGFAFSKVRTKSGGFA
ncbi:lipopolysaccharide biosynthesis protein [Tichowtungia aerotolerans]|uniref:Polysaccharide biosynthesis protein n=1 Tax=Tichowtungia aerotolerans TaxID=2697043 RepID=A0A6P1M7A6_9BACT|nr:hypothetical protein [Tichowtungia aerotolerans]QHI68068.1 hypothetical protein GT409_00900 [Tichowtungia aerotolerans]